LRAADHVGPQSRAAGTEWFLTSVRFLDKIAQTLGLPIEHVLDAAESD
jgi:hypothetical protein